MITICFWDCGFKSGSDPAGDSSHTSSRLRSPHTMRCLNEERWLHLKNKPTEWGNLPFVWDRWRFSVSRRSCGQFREPVIIRRAPGAVSWQVMSERVTSLCLDEERKNEEPSALVGLSKEMNGGMQKFHVVQMRVSCAVRVFCKLLPIRRLKSLQIRALSERLTPASASYDSSFSAL